MAGRVVKGAPMTQTVEEPEYDGPETEETEASDADEE